MGGQLSSEALRAAKQTGQLTLSDMQLSEIPKEIRSLHATLRVLDLSNNPLQVFPRPLKRLTSLQKLVLSFNQLESLPAEVNRLRSLQILHASSNKICSVHGSIFKKCLGLVELDVSNNQLTALPEEMAGCQLHVLYLQGNKFSRVPEVILKLSFLQKLDLSNCELQVLPPGVGALVQLQELSVKDNQLTYIPSQVGELHQIMHIDLSGNKVEALPVQICGCSALKSLNLSMNEIAEFPRSLCECVQLNELKMGSNHVVDIPAEISKLTGLVTLELQANDIKQLPESLGDLVDLQHLNVVGNMIENLPKSLAGLTNLQALDVAGNPLPPELRCADRDELIQRLRDSETRPVKSRFSRIVIRQRSSKPREKSAAFPSLRLDLDLPAPVVPNQSITLQIPTTTPSWHASETPEARASEEGAQVNESPSQQSAPDAEIENAEQRASHAVREALEKLQSGDFLQGEALAKQATCLYGMIGQQPGVQSLARQAAAICVACRLVHEIRVLETSISCDKMTVCLLSIIVAHLPLPEPQHITALLAAITRNYSARNFAVVSRFGKEVLPAIQRTDHHLHLQKILSESANGVDSLLPLYSCPQCRRPTSPGAPACSFCAEPIRFCLKVEREFCFNVEATEPQIDFRFLCSMRFL